MAQIPSSNDPSDERGGPRKDRGGRRKPSLPSPGDSGMLRRRLPVWDAARRLQSKEPSPASDEDSLSEDKLFDEELEDLDPPSAGPVASAQGERALYKEPPIQPPRGPVVADSHRESKAGKQREAESEWRQRETELERQRGEAEFPTSSQPMISQRRIPESGQRQQDRGQLHGEDAWTGNQAVSLWWVLAGAVCLVILLAFLQSSFKTPINPTPMKEPERMVMGGDLSKIPTGDFVARAGEILPVVADVLVKANSAGGPELAQFIRGGEESWLRRQEWVERRPPAARGYYPLTERQLLAASSGQYPYLIMLGMDSNHLTGVAYFISEDDGNFKYDWEASEGYSELLPGEVDQLTGEEPKLMRGVILPSNFYTPIFPEEEYQCYTVHHRDPGEFVWVFA